MNPQLPAHRRPRHAPSSASGLDPAASFRSRPGDGFGQPASDSERLRQFARAYEAHLHGTGAPVAAGSPDLARELHSSSSASAWPSVALGLLIFVLLLAVAIALALLLTAPH